uniref:Biopterin-dependent aromatic amino acid hydroxylase family profile domain-containing protein n=1 Tax=Anguilla anguilla TaxID=7936 RepID=A0A0E9TPW7_ANGAN
MSALFYFTVCFLLLENG